MDDLLVKMNRSAAITLYLHVKKGFASLSCSNQYPVKWRNGYPGEVFCGFSQPHSQLWLMWILANLNFMWFLLSFMLVYVCCQALSLIPLLKSVCLNVLVVT